MDDKLTKQDIKFVKEIVEHGNQTEAAKKAYDIKSDEYAWKKGSLKVREGKIQNAIMSIAEQIPDDELVKVHLEGLRAGRKTEDGIEPDYNVRHKYLDSAYKIKGAYENNGDQNININLMPVLVKFLEKKDDETNSDGNTQRI